MRPLIGILPLFDRQSQNLWINPRYPNGVVKAGGSPVLLHLCGEREYQLQMCSLCDGFVFTGGPDIEPTLFGQQRLPQCGFVLPARDSQELFMLHRVLDLDKPVLGICRGIQLLNVAMGGDLYQDIPTQCHGHINHAQMEIIPFTAPIHPVTVRPNTRLHRLTGQTLLAVNSMHHQAVCRPGQGLAVSAQAPDGLIEAIESTQHRFVLGVQWHPEFLWDQSPAQLALFHGLVQAC